MKEGLRMFNSGYHSFGEYVPYIVFAVILVAALIFYGFWRGFWGIVILIATVIGVFVFYIIRDRYNYRE